MNFRTKRTFLSNFIIILICVFVPCTFFCIMISNLWTAQSKKDIIAKDETMLTLTSHSFDILLQDITTSIDLIEADKQLSDALPSQHSSLWELSAADFLNLDATWQASIRTIIAKPYVSNVYMYLEQHPNFVFTEDRIIELGSLGHIPWLEAYRSQDENVKLWAKPIQTGNTQSVFIFRRLPFLYFGEEKEGVIAVSLERSYFDSLFNNLPQTSERHIFILDNNFTQLYSLRNNDVTQYVQPEDIQLGKSINFSRTSEEGTVLISIVNSSSFNWSYISVIPARALLDQVESLYGMVYAYVLLALLISICLAILVTRRNYRPVRYMIQLIDMYRQKGVIEENVKYSSDEYGYIIYNLIQTFIAKQEADQKLAAEKLLRKESSLLALQSQINPHFLYNTLDAINWESIDQLGIGNSISKMLLCLSSNLRYITRKTDRFVTLQEELDNLQQYIALHELSTSNNISFEIDADEHLLDRSVPVLLLQPLVENAVNHGLSNTQDGLVQIRIADADGRVLIEIQDNGCGFTPERLQEIQTMLSSGDLTGNDSLGLKNVDGRLKLLYGPDCGLHIQSAPSCGCCIQIILPPS